MNDTSEGVDYARRDAESRVQKRKAMRQAIDSVPFEPEKGIAEEGWIEAYETALIEAISPVLSAYEGYPVEFRKAVEAFREEWYEKIKNSGSAGILPEANDFIIEMLRRGKLEAEGRLPAPNLH